jgi:hypothetical protein
MDGPLYRPHPLACFEQKLRLGGAQDSIKNRTYVLASAYRDTPFWQFAERFRSEPGWQVRELPTHHMVNLSMPNEVVAILREVGERP